MAGGSPVNEMYIEPCCCGNVTRVSPTLRSYIHNIHTSITFKRIKKSFLVFNIVIQLFTR